MKIGDLLIGIGRPVAYFPAIARIVGVKECVFLCQLLYWSDKAEKGWIYKTQEEFTNETGLSRAEQETARRNLKKMGLLDERHQRLLHRMFYRVNLDKLDEVWSSPNAGTSHSGKQELALGDGDNPAPAEGVNPHSSLDAETTTENTTRAPATPRPRNELFDVLCEIEGSTVSEIGRKGGGRIAGALRDIKAASPDVTPQEIRRRAGNYRASWPGVTLTANALALHWAKFGTVLNGNTPPPRPNGRYFEQAGSYAGITDK